MAQGLRGIESKCAHSMDRAGHTQPRMALDAAQHTFVNFLKHDENYARSYFRPSALISVHVFYV